MVRSDVYSMYFTQETWDKFNLSEEDFKLQEAIEEAQKEAKEKAKEEKEKRKKELLKNAKGKQKKKLEAALADNKEDSEKEEDKDAAKSLTFEWDYIKDRTSRLTIHSSRLGDAVLSKDGDKLYYLSRFEKKMNLWSTNLRTKDKNRSRKRRQRTSKD